MREIKFRAWDGKEIIPAIHIFINCPGIIWENKRDGLEGKDDIISTKDYIVMQYTGLKDKNGKEIYEGDIIFIPKTDGKNNIGPVVFDLSTLSYRQDRGNNDLRGFSFGYGIEIIGNIYENPNLLTNQ